MDFGARKKLPHFLQIEQSDLVHLSLREPAVRLFGHPAEVESAMQRDAKIPW